MIDRSALNAVPTRQEGALLFPQVLNADAQQDLVVALRAVLAAAPLFQPVMPRTGKPCRCACPIAASSVGWRTDPAIAIKPNTL